MTTIFETILSVEDLKALIDAGDQPLILDCEFDLGDPNRGRVIYTQGHVPGALYLDLERDLSGLSTGQNGRHPLPVRTDFAATLRRLGLQQGQQIVLYDGNGGAYAARGWWMARWLGHHAVAVLDGGRQAWAAAGLPLEAGEVSPRDEGNFALAEPLVAEPVPADTVLANVSAGTLQVIDARDAQRFAGAPHPLDTASGHIPGATNRFFRDNLDEMGRMRPAQELAEAFQTALAGKAASDAVLQCGSGVTACHNALAMEIAGLTGARLYPGSWSEWTSDPLRPIER